MNSTSNTFVGWVSVALLRVILASGKPTIRTGEELTSNTVAVRIPVSLAFGSLGETLKR